MTGECVIGKAQYSTVCILIRGGSDVCIQSQLHSTHSDPKPEINKTEKIGTNEVTVTIEWTLENSYNFSAFSSLPIIFGNTSIQLKVPYNTAHNITVLATPLDPCGQNSVISLYEVYYGECHLL